MAVLPRAQPRQLKSSLARQQHPSRRPSQACQLSLSQLLSVQLSHMTLLSVSPCRMMPSSTLQRDIRRLQKRRPYGLTNLVCPRSMYSIQLILAFTPGRY